MPWFKVDDKLHDHRKARRAGKAAMGVWVMAGSWCGANLTDGFIPEDVAGRWGDAEDFQRLVDVGLWLEDQQDGERGWRFHGWKGFQPLREEWEELSRTRSMVGKAGGLASARARREKKALAEANGEPNG